MKKPMFVLALITGAATFPGCDVHVPFTGTKATTAVATVAAPVPAAPAPAPVPAAVVAKLVAPAAAPVAVAKPAPAPAKPAPGWSRTITTGGQTLTVTLEPTGMGAASDAAITEQITRWISPAYDELATTRVQVAQANAELAAACRKAIEAAKHTTLPAAADVQEELKKAKADLADVRAKLAMIKGVAKTAEINPPAFAEAKPAEPKGPGGGDAK